MLGGVALRVSAAEALLKCFLTVDVLAEVTSQRCKSTSHCPGKESVEDAFSCPAFCERVGDACHRLSREDQQGDGDDLDDDFQLPTVFGGAIVVFVGEVDVPDRRETDCQQRDDELQAEPDLGEPYRPHETHEADLVHQRIQRLAQTGRTLPVDALQQRHLSLLCSSERVHVLGAPHHVVEPSELTIEPVREEAEAQDDDAGPEFEGRLSRDEPTGAGEGQEQADERGLVGGEETKGTRKCVIHADSSRGVVLTLFYCFVNS